MYANPDSYRLQILTHRSDSNRPRPLTYFRSVSYRCRRTSGNLDEKVTERVLYEILIQVGYVVDLHMPRDKETNRHKGYAFAEYETEDIAAYAVKLFSGLVRLHNRTVKFAMSGQSKPSQNSGVPVAHQTESPTLPKPSLVYGQVKEVSQGSAQSPVNCSSTGSHCVSPVYPQASSSGLVNREVSNRNFEYSRRVLGAMFNNANRPAARHPIADQA